MNTSVTTNTIEPPETTDGLEHEPEASKHVRAPLLYHLKASLPRKAGDQGIISGQAGLSETDDCTYETDEIEEPEETKEAKESEETEALEETEEREELATIGPKLFLRLDEAISKCGVYCDRDVNRPLFILAHKVRSIEEELNVRFSADVIAQILLRWQEQNHDQLDNNHDYLTEFLDKLSLVRYPAGRALARAVEIARDIVPLKQTMLLSSDVQLLASLCSVLQSWAGEKPFFLDGRSAATVLSRPHETVASWLRALRHLGVIRLVSKGQRGIASRYEYIDQPKSKRKE